VDGTLLGADIVESCARRALGAEDLVAEHHPVGFGNENWKLRDESGCRFVLKIGDVASEMKWSSSHVAYQLAAAAGLPVPELMHVEEIDGHLVRIFTWIEGESGSGVVAGSQRSDRFLQSVGEAVRLLHTIVRDSFSSRLDGSAPAFPTWTTYIEHRLGQIRERCVATRAVDPGLLDEVSAAVTLLAAAVDDTAEAVLCHRDLHPDNLVVDHEGTVIGIIDWDGAEAWDRAGDWFKLEFELLRAHPTGHDRLVDAYLQGDPIPDRWGERKRLVHLIETLNILPNAVGRSSGSDYSDRARSRMLELLTRVQ
jgi:aminoglycoside phosphotransferase (APT) family kinase protein